MWQAQAHERKLLFRTSPTHEVLIPLGAQLVIVSTTVRLVWNGEW